MQFNNKQKIKLNSNKQVKNKTLIDKNSIKIEGCTCSSCSSKTKTNSVNRNNFFRYNVTTFIKIILSIILIIIPYVFNLNNKVKLVFGIISIMPIGFSMLIDVIKSIKNKDFISEKLLMLIASFGAIIIGEYFEGALVLILFLIGETFENFSIKHTEKSISSLAEITTDTANVVHGGKYVKTSVKNVKVGDIIEVFSGERVSNDGILISEYGVFDTKVISGESLPKEFYKSEEVYSGIINVGAPIKIQVTKTAQNSTANKIVELIKEATKKKSKSQKFITKFAKIYTPIVVIIALFVATIVPLIDSFNFTKWIYSAFSILVISCPCALVISVPLTYFAGIGYLAKKGVLVRGGYYIDKLNDVDLFVFDKTGTITTGEFDVVEIVNHTNLSDNELLKYISSLESKSTHPLSKAIYKKYPDIYCVNNVCEYSGKGIVGIVNDEEVIVGNAKLLNEYKIYNLDTVDGTAIFCAINGKYAGMVKLEDTIKNNIKENINKLKTKNIILSGDNYNKVKNVANLVGINEFKAELLPSGKIDEVKNYISKGYKVAYVGDGINDAPCIKIADVGIAMGGGSSSAISSSDIVIMDNDVKKIVVSKKIAKRTKKIVLENIIGAILIKVAIMVLSIIINLPTFLAVLADVGVMLIAVLNSFRNKLNCKT